MLVLTLGLLTLIFYHRFHGFHLAIDTAAIFVMTGNPLTRFLLRPPTTPVFQTPFTIARRLHHCGFGILLHLPNAHEWRLAQRRRRQVCLLQLFEPFTWHAVGACCGCSRDQRWCFCAYGRVYLVVYVRVANHVGLMKFRLLARADTPEVRMQSALGIGHRVHEEMRLISQGASERDNLRHCASVLAQLHLQMQEVGRMPRVCLEHAVSVRATCNKTST